MPRTYFCGPTHKRESVDVDLVETAFQRKLPLTRDSHLCSQLLGAGDPLKPAVSQLMMTHTKPALINQCGDLSSMPPLFFQIRSLDHLH